MVCVNERSLLLHSTQATPTYNKVLAVSSYMLRFVYNKQRKPEQRLSVSLTLSELTKALATIVWILQKELYTSEFRIGRPKHSKSLW